MERGDDARRAVLVLVAMTLANAMILVDQTAVPLALPNIMTSLHVSAQGVQWVLNGSLLPLAGLLVFGGRLGDLVGRRRVFTAGAILFAGASAVGALAPDLPLLIAARVAQGVGGALMLPTSVAIVSAAYPAAERGKALGTMGGAAAVAAALGPTIGGLLTSAFDWRAVLLINVPLAVVAVVMTRRHVVADDLAAHDSQQIDASGTALLCLTLVGIVFGLSQSQEWGWSSPAIIAALIIALLAAACFVARERRASAPLVDFALLRHRNYLGASASQLLSGMAEIGLGVIFPPLLILNLTMSPALAGLALIPTTVPMILVAPLAGRWYDRVGGRAPLVAGFALLAASAVLLAVTVSADSYVELLPGLLVYGVGLALVLTVNDPVTLDTIPESEHGQASGVSATAEQFGGALGVAVLALISHRFYVDRLIERINHSSLADLTSKTGAELRNALHAAEATGLNPHTFDRSVRVYLRVARSASDHGYSVAFIAVAIAAAVGACLVAWLVRAPVADPPDRGGQAGASRSLPTT
jgi:EmrB/QacA subfamily drug resistance transporter